MYLKTSRDTEYASQSPSTGHQDDEEGVRDTENKETASNAETGSPDDSNGDPKDDPEHEAASGEAEPDNKSDQRH